MKERKENRNSLRSRMLIRHAFEELLGERELDKLTVVDIVSRANVTRSTFYVHYPDIYGIIEEIQGEIISRHLEEFSQIEYRNMLQDPTPYLKSVASMLEENNKLFKKLGHNIQMQKYMGILQRTIIEDTISRSDVPAEIRSPSAFSIRIRFFLAGILSTMQSWVEGNQDCTLDEICKELSQLIQQSASDFLGTDWTAH
ncbi:MAG: TetR/AcrR family transcriptional regulator C-terminal domain-containing protein [Oscillospiraceae bacterium]|nr:TetR/AcrR family transcriptional regulator C-terminal domain-containing protein [Oscillospiraceae bacterium]